MSEEHTHLWARHVECTVYEMWMVEFVPTDGPSWFAGGGTFDVSVYDADSVEWSRRVFREITITDEMVAIQLFKDNWADFPLESFDSEQEAINWIKEQMEE